ncbi:hypothetical protein WJX84_005771 [Apatococcus fuscideae]|uniref:J domain-containing protein n=1 Tax=Apatococcus fuscideae TaxID=2026836 RepID=A0AAW1T6D5_9CHLO
MSDPYKVLGIEPSASPQEVKRAYRAKCLQHHPDLFPTFRRAAAERKFQEISQACSSLTKAHAGFTRKPSSRAYSAYKKASPVTNVTLAFVIAVPLALTGVWLATTSDKMKEQSWRKNGLMYPPVNPWLREDQLATQSDHFKRSKDGAASRPGSQE